MGQTENFELPILSPSEIDTIFGRDWVLSINGDDPESGFMKIDAILSVLQKWQAQRDTSPVTWGMLKTGFGESSVQKER